MVDTNNNKKPESNSIEPDKDISNPKFPETTDSIIEPSGFYPPYWTETPQNQNSGNLEEDLESENQPPQENITSISGEKVNLAEPSPAEASPVEEEYPTEEKNYPMEEKPYPGQPPEEPQRNLEQVQTTTLIPEDVPPKSPTDAISTIAYEEEKKFTGEVAAQHEQQTN